MAYSAEPIILDHLEDGLILRRSTPKDADALGEFNATIHSDDGPDKPDDRLAAWTRDLLTRPHPTFDPADFTIVEEASSGKIVSSLNLISQTWSYAGIEFKVGRPELVGTLPEYRGRGLVRRQFDVVHRWSAERGELVQAITGIPYFYRQFGYEMAMNLSGGRMGYPHTAPKLKDGESEPYRIRPALLDDLPLIDLLDRRSRQRNLVSCVRDLQSWRYELDGKHERNVNRLELRMIETAAGEPIGFLAQSSFPWIDGAMFATEVYELAAGVSWAAVTPSVIRYLIATGQAYSQALGRDPFGVYGLWLGEHHPAYDVAPHRVPRIRPPYAWYMRVPDLPAFLTLIRPVLEANLEASAFAGHTGELKITFYRDGLHLVFEKGKLSVIERWKPEPQGHSGNAAFPDLTFLQLVFGYRSTAELSSAFADCWFGNDEIEALLQALFPRQASNVKPIA